MPDADEIHRYSVRSDEDGTRLDRFLAGKLREQAISREKIKNLIKHGAVQVNGVIQTTPKYSLKCDDEVYALTPRATTAIAAEKGELTVLYRDNSLAVINKPAGISVHPSPGLPSGTLANLLLSHFPELISQEGFRPGIVHRLDKDTSGLMLVALSERCRLLLAEQFAHRDVYKEYLALVYGVPLKNAGSIEAPIGRHPSHKTRMAVVAGGKPARSEWRLLHADPHKRFSLVAVRILTGRTHQVRVHMQYIGHSLLGDKVYTNGAKSKIPNLKAQRQMLHAWKLHFKHPFAPSAGLDEIPKDTDGKIQFLCPPPRDFLDCMLSASHTMLRVVITGSPGCGKSTLTEMLQKRGLPCYNADAVIAAMYQPGGDGHHLLRTWFGQRFVPDEKSPVDKIALGRAMQENEILKRQIDSLLHPLVWKGLQDFWLRMDDEGHKISVAEIPLYLESGRQNHDDAHDGGKPLLVGVHCPFAQRKKRLMEKRGWSEETISKIESWQWPEEKKMSACDVVINNTGDIAALVLESAKLADLLESILLERSKTLAADYLKLWIKD